MQPTVLMNHHRNTALVVATSGKNLLVIKLGKGRLTVTSLSITEIKAQGYAACDYSPKQAAHNYLQHGAGVSERAKRYLEQVTGSECSDILTFT